MTSSSDLILLPYTPDLTQAGIAYACRSFVLQAEMPTGHLPSHLRQCVATKAAELALHRYLDDEHIPYLLQNSNSLADPEQADLFLGGKQCEIICSMISSKTEIRKLRVDPTLFLSYPAKVPRYTFTPERSHDDDLFIFCFVTGLVTRRPSELARARHAKQPFYLLHPFPKDWARPQHWHPTAELDIKAECLAPLTIELAGKDAEGKYQDDEITLLPHQVLHPHKTFYTLAYVHSTEQVEGRIGIYSHQSRKTYLIEPYQWHNIWVYGMDVFLAGWISRNAYRNRDRSTEIPGIASRPHLKTPDLTISELYSIGSYLNSLK